jgi:hypothetical protein
MTDKISIKENCVTSINTLIEQFKENDYMLQRIYNHIVVYLPNVLENENKNYEKRIIRNHFLTNEQQIFIQVFLSKNKYFYLPNNNFFYQYDGEKYMIIKEDDIIHKLLSTISSDRVLLQWKHKTKLNIIKQIKERSLFSSIPETDTVQNVLNVLYPLIFTSKNAAKYFLTIVGDNILKKNPQLIFLVSTKMKQLLNELESVSVSSIGNNSITHNFVTKYHETHTYEICRLIKINENFSKQMWRELLKEIGLDLLCLAVHYSKRYENSDNFINIKSDEDLKQFTYYLKQSSQSQIVDEFCNKYIITNNSNTNSENNYNMEWKNLHFVWKQFLSNSNLQNIIYSNTLKNIFKEKYIYDENTDTFLGITSKYVPVYNDFIKFWESTITHHVSNPVFDYDFEIDELCSLFKVWVKQSSHEQIMTNGNISEENILKILKHFFPLIEIDEEKYVLNITSSLWDKNTEIENSFQHIKEQIIKNENNQDLISFDDIYNYYYKNCSLKLYKFIVSKRYFEKYLYYKFSDLIVYEKFIETKIFFNQHFPQQIASLHPMF